MSAEVIQLPTTFSPPPAAVRPTWEEYLRAAWEVDAMVALRLDARCGYRYHRGKVRHVAPTGAFAVVGTTHIPIECIENAEMEELR